MKLREHFQEVVQVMRGCSNGSPALPITPCEHGDIDAPRLALQVPFYMVYFFKTQ